MLQLAKIAESQRSIASRLKFISQPIKIGYLESKDNKKLSKAISKKSCHSASISKAVRLAHHRAPGAWLFA